MTFWKPKSKYNTFDSDYRPECDLDLLELWVRHAFPSFWDADTQTLGFDDEYLEDDEGLKEDTGSPYNDDTAAPTEYTADAEVRTTSATGGQKGTKQARFDLIPAGPLWELAELYGAGAKKYSDHNWRKGYEWSKSFAALMRHAWLFWNGQNNDVETGRHHMASVVFHAFALIEYGRTHPEFDDRCNDDE